MSGATVIPYSIMPQSEIISVLTADYLSTSQVASLLGVSRWTLADMRLKRQGPPFVRRKRGVIVYPRGAFEAYLRQGQNRARDVSRKCG